MFSNLYCTYFPKQTLVFTCLQYKSFENTEGKGEIARNEQFLLFPQCFLTIGRTFYHFHQICNCCLQTLSVWKCFKICRLGKGYMHLKMSSEICFNLDQCKILSSGNGLIHGILTLYQMTKV